MEQEQEQEQEHQKTSGKTNSGTLTGTYMDQLDLYSYKQVELKQLAKFNQLTQSGNKTVLIQKIQAWFQKNVHARRIQSHMRGYFVRNALNVSHRGKAYMDRSLCVNECDFYTMDPLPTIPFPLFFSYTDKEQFTYGFDLHSLLMLHRKHSEGEIINPYNRSPMDSQLFQTVLRLYRFVRIVFPTLKMDGDVLFPPTSRRQRHRAPPRRNIVHENTLVVNPEHVTRYQMHTIAIVTRLDVGNVHLVAQWLERKRVLYEARQKPTNTRIQELFMEIDQLGNYTDSSWMTQLNITSMQLLYRNLMDIWMFRARIPNDVQHQICPIEDPFHSVAALLRNHQRINILDDWRQICLCVMENMIYMSHDVEYRKLGAMHVLTALTQVSPAAQNAFMWLYESLY